MTPPHPGAVRRSLRRALPGTGPLVRASDRVEALGRVLAVALVLLALPAAVAVATAVRSDLMAAAATRAASEHRTTGTTLVDAVWPTRGAYGARVPVPTLVTDPDGLRREIRAVLPGGTPAGTEVPVWLTDSGAVTPPPRGVGAVAVDAALDGGLVFLGTVLAAVGGQVVLRRRLARGRDRRWTDEWALVEPTWTHRAT